MEGWRVGVGEGEPNGFKSVTAFYPEETTTSNGISLPPLIFIIVLLATN